MIDDQLNNCIDVEKEGIQTIRISDDDKKYTNIISLKNWKEIYNFISNEKIFKIVQFDECQFKFDVNNFISECMHDFIGRPYKDRPDVMHIEDYYLKNNGQFLIAYDVKEKEIFPEKFTKWIDSKIIFNIVEDKQVLNILNYDIKFLDTHAIKEKQFGFKTTLENGKTIAFLGDEPFKEILRDEIENIDWLLHEAMCTEEEKDIYKPHEKSHSTVKDAAEIAESLKAKNLVLYHTDDTNIEKRKELYTTEAKKYFSGNIYVPNDLEVINL